MRGSRTSGQSLRAANDPEKRVCSSQYIKPEVTKRPSTMRTIQSRSLRATRTRTGTQPTINTSLRVLRLFFPPLRETLRLHQDSEPSILVVKIFVTLINITYKRCSKFDFRWYYRCHHLYIYISATMHGQSTIFKGQQVSCIFQFKPPAFNE